MPIGYKLENKILNEAKNIEHHFHTREFWIGNNGGNAEEDNLTPFQITSGNNLFGNAVQILDTGDTPFVAGNVEFDLHRLLVTALDQATVYYLRIIWGTGTVSDAETAKQYTTSPSIRVAAGAVSKGTPNEIKFPKIPVGNKVWVKCKNVTNGAIIDLLFGGHEYDFLSLG